MKLPFAALFVFACAEPVHETPLEKRARLLEERGPRQQGTKSKWNWTCASAGLTGNPAVWAKCEEERAAERGEAPPAITETRCKRERDGSERCITIERKPRTVANDKIDDTAPLPMPQYEPEPASRPVDTNTHRQPVRIRN